MFKSHGRAFGLAIGLAFVLFSQAQASTGAFFAKDGTLLSELATASRQVINLCFDRFTVIYEYTENFDAEGYFRADEPTAPDLRVRIENVTFGLSDVPFSDRSYDSPSGFSEYIRFRPGDKHRTSSFTVKALQTGTIVNKFRFRIYHGSTGAVVNAGVFEIPVSHHWFADRIVYSSSPVCNNGPIGPLPPMPLPPVPHPRDAGPDDAL